MKKLILILALFALVITGCKDDKPEKNADNSDNSEVAEASPNSEILESKSVSEIAALIIENGDFPETVSRDKDRLTEYANFSDIETEFIVEAALYFNPAGANSDEILILKTTSPEKAEEMKSYFNDYITERIPKWENYQPAEVYKLENAIIEVKGEYVTLLICADAESAAEIFKDNV